MLHQSHLSTHPYIYDVMDVRANIIVVMIYSCMVKNGKRFVHLL